MVSLTVLPLTVTAVSSVNMLELELETHPALYIKLHTIFEHCHISSALIFLVFGREARLSLMLLYIGM